MEGERVGAGRADTCEELAPQHRPGAMQPRLDRFVADLQKFGGLTSRQALDVSADEHDSIRFRQRIDRTLEQLPELSGVGESFGIGHG